jgi:hypothetical protein
MRELLEFVGQSTLPAETQNTAFMDGDRYKSDQLNFLTFIDLFDERGRSVTSPEEMRGFLSSVAEESGMNDVTIGRVAQYAYKVGRISKNQLDLIEQGIAAGEVKPLALTDEMRADIRFKIDMYKAKQLERKLREALPNPDDDEEEDSDSKKRKDTFTSDEEPEIGSEEDEAPGVPGGEEENPEELGGADELGAEDGIPPEGGSAGAPLEGEEDPDGEVVEPEEEAQAERPLEIEFIGMNKDKALSYTLKRIMSPEGDVTDLQVIDQMETPVMSANKDGLDITDVSAFLKQAILKLDMDDGVAGVIKKYDLFGIEAAEKARMEELEGTAGEEDEVPGEMELPKAETKPGDFGHVDGAFNPMTHEALVKEAAAKAEGGDWKSVLDRNGVDPDSRFRAGNRIFFRCPDPSLAQSVAAQLGARLDGTVSYEGLEFVRAVLEGCADESPEAKKWKAIHKNMSKAQLSQAAKKAARNRKKNEGGENLVPTPEEMAEVLLASQVASEIERRGEDNPDADLPNFMGEEITNWMKDNVVGWANHVQEFVNKYSQQLNQYLEQHREQWASGKGDWVESVAGGSLAEQLGYDEAWEICNQQFGGVSEHKVREEYKVLASGITDKALADQIASTKKGTAIQDPEDKTKTKWIVVADEKPEGVQ